MKVHLLALVPGMLNGLAKDPRVLLRRRRGGAVWTQIECHLEDRPDGKSIAVPVVAVPPGTAAPLFRAQILQERTAIPKSGFAVALKPQDPLLPSDPEQRLLKPILSTPERIIFEVNRAEVLFLAPDGAVELSWLDVHPETGGVTARQLASFHTGTIDLVGRCRAQIDGTADLFPPTPRPEPRPPTGTRVIPRILATLFGDLGRPRDSRC
jgi:hypothetical protein